jgi:hypothetical protein
MERRFESHVRQVVTCRLASPRCPRSPLRQIGGCSGTCSCANPLRPSSISLIHPNSKTLQVCSLVRLTHHRKALDNPDLVGPGYALIVSSRGYLSYIPIILDSVTAARIGDCPRGHLLISLPSGQPLESQSYACDGSAMLFGEASEPS